MRNSTKRLHFIPAQKCEFLKAVGTNDRTMLIESQRNGNASPKAKIIVLVSEDLIFVYNDVSALNGGRCRIALIARYTDIGEAVTDNAKCASSKVKFVLLMLARVASKMGIV